MPAKVYLTAPRKYRNQPVFIDNIRFASKREAARYQELRLMERAEIIDCLETQPPFVLNVKGQKICEYIADFQYYENGKMIVEDCKGFKTPAYRIKKKLMKAIYGIEIRET